MTECISTYKVIFACNLSKLATKYYKQLGLGDSCAEDTLYKMVLIKALLKTIECEDNTCLTDDEICTIIDNIKKISKSCGCGCS
jgi:hypothetical protein